MLIKNLVNTYLGFDKPELIIKSVRQFTTFAGIIGEISIHILYTRKLWKKKVDRSESREFILTLWIEWKVFTIVKTQRTTKDIE